MGTHDVQMVEGFMRHLPRYIPPYITGKAKSPAARRDRMMASHSDATDSYLIRPNPDDHRLSAAVAGTDQSGRPVDLSVVIERPLTIFLNGQEIVTAMTIGDYPAELAVVYLRNQNMLRADDVITQIDHDADGDVVVVRTERETDSKTS